MRAPPHPCERGHSWSEIGGRNCGCNTDAQCSVPVHECEVCGDCDYGENAQAADVLARCEGHHACKKSAPVPPPYPALLISKAEFDALPEYSATLPTGTTPGKRWKRHDGIFDQEFLAAGGKPFWLIGEYNPDDDGKGSTIKVNWYIPVPRIDAPLSGGAA